MSIPLDRHYHYLENICGDDTIIYHWYPHGSKKLDNLTMFRDYSKINQATLNLMLPVVFHDQEPLSLGNYTADDISNLQQYRLSDHPQGSLPHVQELFKNMSPVRLKLINPLTVYDKIILCHSEKNSSALEQFEEQGFIGVYFWSHAIIARDWFRYAEHDSLLKHNNRYNYDFLIYNRAWGGTREYRLKFCEMLVDADLITSCKTSFAEHDHSVHYTDHVFQNTAFDLSTTDLEKHFVKNITTSCYSADYDNTDYKECGIEVVLETLFDDQRNHLTEKSLRPIACNKPFILAATPHSLEYLRSYGFKTFSGMIDETYDTIADPYLRLKAIISELKRISCLPMSSKQELWEKLNVVAQYNHDLFFSNKWQDSIIDEFKTNLDCAVDIANQNKTGKYLRNFYRHPVMNQPLYQTENRKILNKWLADNGYSY